MSADPVRATALRILAEVYAGASLDALLDRALDSRSEDQERAFLAELVRGTLQWRGRYQHILAQFIERKMPTDDRLLALFHLSLHQLLALDGVPAFAVLHQAGELCRRQVGAGKVGFVNGVLQAVRRRLVSDDPVDGVRHEELAALFAGLEEGSPEHLAAWYSHPLWLVRRWLERHGPKRTAALLEFNNRPVRLAFRVLAPGDPGATSQTLSALGLAVESGADPRCLLVQGRPPRAAIAAALEQHPRLIVQDPAVQEATGWLLSGLPAPSGPILDMCAAPGGKTARLAAAWPEAERLVAMDSRPHRVRMLAGTVRRLQDERIEVVEADGLAAPFAAGTFGAVLLDGPCSGTGVLRHHPDGRWQLPKNAPARNGRTLRKLAHAAVDLLAPGGYLLYATCSLEIHENERVLDKLLAERDDLQPVGPQDGPWRRQWLPGEGDTPGDGFFAARLRRKEQGQGRIA